MNIKNHSNKILVSNSLEETIKKGDAILILTRWDEFKKLDLKGKLLFNGTLTRYQNEEYSIGR